MRQKRAKAYKRLMNLYSQTFGFRTPFQVLVGHDFLLQQADKQLDLPKQLATCVQAECKPMITQCSVEALYKLGKEAQSVTNLAKNFERRRCNHREAIPEEECLRDVIGETNKHRYVVAVHSPRLRTHFRTIPGIPIIHFNDRGVMVMENPSEATTRHKEQLEIGKLREQLANPAPKLDNIIGGDAPPSTDAPRKRKAGPKAPNPLSQRSKKDKVQGRLSKKELEAQAEARAGRGKKRVRDEEEGDSEGEEEEGPGRSAAVEGKSDDDEAEDRTSKVRFADATEGNSREDRDGQKKRKRKRRKKAATEDTETGAVADDSDDDSE